MDDSSSHGEATVSRLRLKTRRILRLLIAWAWFVALVVIPYATALLARTRSQAIVCVSLLLLVVGAWLTRIRDDEAVTGGTTGKVGAPFRGSRAALVAMVAISLADLVFGVPYFAARVRDLAGPADNTRVCISLNKIIEAIDQSSTPPGGLADLLRTGAISPSDLRPAGMSIRPMPGELRNLQSELRLGGPGLTAAVQRYSIFHYLRHNGSLVIVSRPVRDIQFGRVRLLGFRSGVVIESVVSRSAALSFSSVKPPWWKHLRADAGAEKWPPGMHCRPVG